MRTEKEMLDLIVLTAKSDERIRAVVLNGSRANPDARRDPFRDYDVVYVVRDVLPFREHREWLAVFGEMMIMQTPDDMGEPAPDGNGRYAYLMQFTDGNRIDLTLLPVEAMAGFKWDSLSVLLIDKDCAVGPLEPPDESDYLPVPPTARQFADCVNEFWWVCPYVAKGLWRGEALYTRHVMEHVIRKELTRMAVWCAGARTAYERSPGKFGKDLPGLLGEPLAGMLMRTCAGCEPDDVWEALLTAGDVFRIMATEVAARFGFEYPQEVDKRVCAHLRHVRRLPADATEIY